MTFNNTFNAPVTNLTQIGSYDGRSVTVGDAIDGLSRSPDDAKIVIDVKRPEVERWAAVKRVTGILAPVAKGTLEAIAEGVTKALTRS